MKSALTCLVLIGCSVLLPDNTMDEASRRYHDLELAYQLNLGIAKADGDAFTHGNPMRVCEIHNAFIAAVVKICDDVPATGCAVWRQGMTADCSKGPPDWNPWTSAANQQVADANIILQIMMAPVPARAEPQPGAGTTRRAEEAAGMDETND